MSRLSPYFQSLAKQKRVCPDCLKGVLTIEPSLDPNGAYEKCAKCGYIRSITAPKSAWVDWEPDEEPELNSWFNENWEKTEDGFKKPKARIISFDSIRKGAGT